MKVRTKEENAAHARAQRLRKKLLASVSPDAKTPVPPAQKRTSDSVSPTKKRTTVAPAAVPPGVNPDSGQNSRTGKMSSSAPESVRPGCSLPANAAPAQVSAAVCQNCERLRAEVSRLLAQIVALEDQLSKRPTAGSRHVEKISQDDAEALTARVVAAKVERINSYSRGHVIGTART
jgi:hypothetical protein